MFILNLEVDDLHGKDYKVPFGKNLVLLYGLNGSGKTTIMDIVYYILKGEAQQTFKYNYKYLKLEYNSSKSKNTLEILRNDDKEKYEIRLNNEILEVYNFHNDADIYDEIIFRNEGVIRRESTGVYKKNSAANDKYRQLMRKERNELVYVPLDRKVKGIENKLQRQGRLYNSSNKVNIENSLQIAESYYKEYLRYITESENHIHIRMRSEILSHLSEPTQDWRHNLDNYNHKKFSNLIVELKDVINEALNNNVTKLIEIYNTTYDSFIQENNEINVIDAIKFLDYSYAVAQLNNLYKVTEALSPLKKAIDDLKMKSEMVINSVNDLLKETEKSIYFSRSEGSFFFTHLNKKESINLNHLSSGEKQIIMFYIFSIVKFEKNKTKILFIDEPELSLHIEWQAKLLPSIISSNEDTQIIIATHSPDIIGGYVENCVEVKGKLI